MLVWQPDQVCFSLRALSQHVSSFFQYAAINNGFGNILLLPLIKDGCFGAKMITSIIWKSFFCFAKPTCHLILLSIILRSWQEFKCFGILKINWFTIEQLVLKKNSTLKQPSIDAKCITGTKISLCISHYVMLLYITLNLDEKGGAQPTCLSLPRLVSQKLGGSSLVEQPPFSVAMKMKWAQIIITLIGIKNI